MATVNYAYGDMSALARIPSGKAHIMALGDSISNDNNTNFTTWSQGAVRYARPQRWDAVHSMVSQSGSSQGRFTIIEASQNSGSNTNIAPGEQFGNVDLRGVSPHIYAHATINANAPENAFYTAFRWRAMFVDKDTDKHLGEDIYINADNTPAIEVGDSVVYTNLVMSRTDIPGWIDDIAVKQVTEGVGGSGKVNRSLSAIDNRPGVHIYAVDSDPDPVDASYFDANINYIAASVDHQGSGTWGTTPLNYGVVGAIANIGERDGFRWVYSGNGGWQSGNHLDDYPDGTDVSGGANGRSYTDEGLEDYIKSTETNTFFLYLGANDPWTNPGDGETVADNLEGIIARLRDACAAVGVTDDKYIIVGASVIDRGANAAAARSQKKVMADQLQRYAVATTDVVFLDLQEYLETRFDFTNLPTPGGSGNPWCDFGTMGVESTNPNPDYVHPNWDGMDLMWNDFFWPAALAAEAGGTSDIPRALVEVDIFSYKKAEDTDPSLGLLSPSGWWVNPNASYTLDTGDLPADQIPQENINNSNPRIRGGNNGAMLVDVQFASQAQRTNFLDNVSQDAFLRFTVDSDGQEWIGESKTITELLNDNTPNAQDFAPAANSKLIWSVYPNDWVAGPNIPIDSPNGFGSVQGWDVDMGVSIELVGLEEAQGDGTFQFAYQVPSLIRKLDYEDYFSKINTLQRQRYAEGADLPYTVDPIVVSTPLEYKKLLAVVKTFDNK